ncbi:MAG: antitoxin family protein [Blastocatellia bacterium]
MTITFEAIYESGVLIPLIPLKELKEKQKVQVNVETGSVVDRLLANPIQIDPQIAREIAENPEFSLLES